MPAGADSENRLYEYIRRSLGDMGWYARNPAKNGDVYYQNEVSEDADLGCALAGVVPDHVVVISAEHGSVYWVIEAKSRSENIHKAIEEAEEYAETINSALPGKARFVSGVAGSPEDSHYVVTKFLNGGKWEEISINGYKTTGFISEEQCLEFLRENSSSIDRFEYSPEVFLRKANRINAALRSNDIPVGDRAKTIAALLLAIAQNGSIQTRRKASEMIRMLNACIDNTLDEYGKAKLSGIFRIQLPTSDINPQKYRNALVETLQILRDMNIRSAINSGEDALGQFYETFLKYTNGAKEMGIVLTPRHITKFAAEATLIASGDRVFDPACGTGGFLVSAMDHVKQRSRKHQSWEKFQSEGLYGVEQRDDVYGLAVVNMIFRGDGKSNIHSGDCFAQRFSLENGAVGWQSAENKTADNSRGPFTKVLMNPPFKLKGSPERKFVDCALDQMQEEGLLFAVLPAVVIRGGGTHETWRRQLLKRHTLKAVVKFDTDLFYPVAEATYGIILEAHIPHDCGSEVFWAEVFDAKHAPRLSKMKSKEKAADNLEKIKNELVKFMQNQTCRKRITDALILKKIGGSIDFSPEPRLPRPARKRHPDAKIRSLGLEIAKAIIASEPSVAAAPQKMRKFRVSQFVAEDHAAPIAKLKDLEPGSVPVVSATQYNNGIQGWYSVPDSQILENCVSISKTHNTNPCQAFYHPYRFSGISTAIYITLTPPLAGDENAILYFCEAIARENKPKFHYARPVKLDELHVYLPVNEAGEVDIEAMAELVKSQTAIPNS